jgi:hypothetical protein
MRRRPKGDKTSFKGLLYRSRKIDAETFRDHKRAQNECDLFILKENYNQ